MDLEGISGVYFYKYIVGISFAETFVHISFYMSQSVIWRNISRAG